ncbi:aspartyl-phosphate phosphatase Spo0E family protein [Peribacillus sp. SCS-155]|uniref:aspartyl-phosphate phosphatase Spo0E family protein n=1 Tax=Peribacillus sedimenti TaxID=3115297 RepID=UPI0039060AA5
MITIASDFSMIEEKRQEMIASAELLGYTDPFTIKFSQELDTLLNEELFKQATWYSKKKSYIII